MRNEHPSRELALCFILSIMLHCATVVGLVATNGWSFGPGTHSSRSSDPSNPEDPPIPMVQLSDPPLPPPPPLQDQQIQLGDENSDAVSMTWLGFDEATPHAADQGEVEQPALKRDPSAGGHPVPAIPAVDPAAMARATTEPAPRALEQLADPPEEAPTPKPAHQPSPPPPPPPAGPEQTPEAIDITEPDPAENLEDPTEHVPPQDEHLQPPQENAAPKEEPNPAKKTPEDQVPPEVQVPPDDKALPEDQVSPDDKTLPDDPLPPDDTVPPDDQPQSPEQAPPQEQSPPQNQQQPQPTPQDPSVAPAEASAPQEPVPGGKGESQGQGEGDSDAVGMADDRESDASSIENFAIKELGKPLAARGLKIITTKPRLSYHTQIMGWGADPVVRIYFASDGRVRDVDFLQESGNPDIDRPVKDALFLWRAEGKALAALGDPLTGETIPVDVRIIK